MNKKNVYLALRVVMGFIFLWAFIDKLFGLGFATKPEAAWIHGGSPTAGFLGHAVTGPFVSIYHALAGMVVVDWLFMFGLFFIGLSLIFGKCVKWGALAGVIMLALMYLALIPPVNNPIIDEHIVYILVLSLFILDKDSQIAGAKI